MLPIEKVHTPTPLKAVGGASRAAASKASGRQAASKSQAVSRFTMDKDTVYPDI